MSWIHETTEGVVLNLRIVPRASKNEIGEILDNALKIRLQAPPVEGKANKALVKFLAKTLGIPARNITILSGETGRNKRILIGGMKEEDLDKKLPHM